MLVLATSVSVTVGSQEVVKMPCIYYLVQFKDKKVKALLDGGSKINTLNPNYAEKLGFKIWKTNIGA